MVNVTCAIIEKDNKILIAQRSKKMFPPLKWEFPGGKIFENESAEECIIREIKEELNIEIKIIEQLKNSSYNYGSKIVNLIPFTTKYISGKITLLEHKEYKWIAPETIFNFDLAEADIPIAKDYLQTIYK